MQSSRLIPTAGFFVVLGRARQESELSHLAFAFDRLVLSGLKFVFQTPTKIISTEYLGEGVILRPSLRTSFVIRPYAFTSGVSVSSRYTPMRRNFW